MDLQNIIMCCHSSSIYVDLNIWAILKTDAHSRVPPERSDEWIHATRMGSFRCPFHDFIDLLIFMIFVYIYIFFIKVSKSDNIVKKHENRYEAKNILQMELTKIVSLVMNSISHSPPCPSPDPPPRPWARLSDSCCIWISGRY